MNGMVVGSVGSISELSKAAAAQSSLTPFDITAFLGPGQNEVSVRVQNGPASFSGAGCSVCTFEQNPTGVLLDGTISYNAAVQVFPGTWGRVKVTYR